MKITKKVSLDMETGEILFRDWYDYYGPVEECKGGASAQQQQISNQLSQEQLQMMQSQLAMANPTLQSIIQNGGMLPQQQAAETSLAMNSLPQQFNNLYGQINNNLVARGVTGGNMAGGGGIASGYGALGAQEAQQQSGLLSGIQQQKGQQLQSALGMAYGLAPTFNQGAISANSTAASAAQAADQSQTGFWGSLMGGLGALGSSAITKCWVARAVYGETSWEAEYIRLWLADRARKQFSYRAIDYLYGVFGRAVAVLVKRYRPLKLAFKCLMDKVLPNG